jgi:hypothetical protein
MVVIGVAGAALADPAGRPTPAFSRLPDPSDGLGSQGGDIYRGCPAGPGLGDAPWRGCRHGAGMADHGPGASLATSR